MSAALRRMTAGCAAYDSGSVPMIFAPSARVASGVEVPLTCAMVMLLSAAVLR
jgi:hypothetical protein